MSTLPWVGVAQVASWNVGAVGLSAWAAPPVATRAAQTARGARMLAVVLNMVGSLSACLPLSLLPAAGALCCEEDTTPSGDTSVLTCQHFMRLNGGERGPKGPWLSVKRDAERGGCRVQVPS